MAFRKFSTAGVLLCTLGLLPTGTYAQSDVVITSVAIVTATEFANPSESQVPATLFTITPPAYTGGCHPALSASQFGLVPCPKTHQSGEFTTLHDTRTTVVSESFTTTITETAPPTTFTQTVSEIDKSTILSTGLCYWGAQNVITPCTAIAQATSKPTPNAAIGIRGNNPFKRATYSVKHVKESLELAKREMDKVVGGIMEYKHEILKRNSDPVYKGNCRVPPLPQTPFFIAIGALLHGIWIALLWKQRGASNGLRIVIYWAIWGFLFFNMVYVDIYHISIGPAWKDSLRKERELGLRQ